MSTVIYRTNVNFFTAYNYLKDKLIFTINNKPIEEFQYVKIVTLNELLGYIKYFKPSFSTMEIQVIANYLFKLTNSQVL